jgi:hypothetical protein
MRAENNLAIQDVEIFDHRPIPTSIQKVKLYYNSKAGENCYEIGMSLPLRLNHLVCFAIEDESPAKSLTIGKIDSIKSFANIVKSLLINIRMNISRPEEFNSLVFDAREVYPNNIGHLMLQVIPFCLHVKNSSKQEVTFVFNKLHPPFKKLLEVFGIHPTISDARMKGRFVKVFATRHLAAYDALNLIDSPTTAFLPEIYSPFKFSSGLTGMSKIFIARRGARGLLNLAEVEGVLNAYGYKTIFMEDYPIDVQLGIAQEAQEIVAVHGASMSMLAMKPNIKSLIEIIPPNVYLEFFPIALANKVEKFVQVTSYFDEKIAFNGWETIIKFKNAPFSLDVALLKKALEEIHPSI